MLREIPDCVAFWRVAPEVRFNAFAIFSTGSLRAKLLRVRISSLVHDRFRVGFLLFTGGLAIWEFPLLCDRLIASRRRSGVNAEEPIEIGSIYILCLIGNCHSGVCLITARKMLNLTVSGAYCAII
jgi:hypothetical protein